MLTFDFRWNLLYNYTLIVIHWRSASNLLKIMWLLQYLIFDNNTNCLIRILSLCYLPCWYDEGARTHRSTASMIPLMPDCHLVPLVTFPLTGHCSPDGGQIRSGPSVVIEWAVSVEWPAPCPGTQAAESGPALVMRKQIVEHPSILCSNDLLSSTLKWSIWEKKFYFPSGKWFLSPAAAASSTPCVPIVV